MAANLKPKVTPPIAQSMARKERVVAERKEIRLSIPSVIALWGLVAGMMVVVFFFGVHAGLEQGLKKALDEQQNTVARLPLPPVAADLGENSPNGVGNIVANAGTGTGNLVPPSMQSAGLLAEDGLKPTVTANPPTLDKSQERFDFSQSVVSKQQSSDGANSGAVAGLVAKTTSEILANPAGDEVSVVAKKIEIKKTIVDSAPNVAEDSRGVVGEVASNTTKKTEVSPAKGETKKPQTTERSVPLKAGYYIQVAAPTSRSDAEAILTRVSKKGVSGRIQEIRVDGVLYFRVISGPEKTRAKAESSKKKILSAKAVKGTPFVRYIGSNGR